MCVTVCFRHTKILQLLVVLTCLRLQVKFVLIRAQLQKILARPVAVSLEKVFYLIRCVLKANFLFLKEEKKNYLIIPGGTNPKKP